MKPEAQIRGRPFKKKHGHASWCNKSRTYRSWLSMKSRCKRSPFYTSKGISVCERWSVFDALTKIGFNKSMRNL